MNNTMNLYSRLPKVDQILEDKRIENLYNIAPREIIADSTRAVIAELRDSISNKQIALEELDRQIYFITDTIEKKVRKAIEPKLKKVINCTGVVIHTNLGRSLISKEIMEHMTEISSSYNNLEFDLETGVRGSRYSHLEDIIKKITGAEAALVVNNNAAAVVLALSSLAKSKEVIVSRGELVEIGGSFRIPEVMEQSGAKLVDVGTTNKTHLKDYESSINENTAAFLKVHTSNYRILGFTASVSLEELVNLGEQYHIPVIEDLGSGVLVDLRKYGLQYEPTVQDSVNAGVDVITFSGDKLLGGPQAGIIIGKKKYIDVMKRHPLNRALRIDKFTIAALESTLRLYIEEDIAINKIPTLKMLTATQEELNKKAEKLLSKINQEKSKELTTEIVDDYSQVGGGSMPLEQLPTKCIMIYSDKISVSSLEKGLRSFSTPIVTRIFKDRLYIDLRTVDEKEFDTVAEGIKFASSNNLKECY
ncbi:L-seryl-tRNA(Sec) selenium transferase [Proteiniborus ethanoligenes]|uniref:L-seryl-tRNA(Sec) selenium transferase n=1 Tax=Proteiniborus ethanoligenes TaxID=415015 RepID=A0A1H3SA69_9FIRM|nr:L-seryl-tRNA(Sec) selenium transferase [Proteiniborus ethanoligenes]TAH63779.1 MAG: L-seryl-tRNA(Sec) selenium transferase [Gottschalkiaceae bacterium]SDZ34570.1 L-seryl-tRNA(Sec) selenium transferase [Proteiniborus ethanoligenes]